MAFSPLGPSKPVQHVKGKPPQRGSQAPKSPIGPELGTLPGEQRAGAQRGRSGVRQEKARIGVDFNTATEMWGGYQRPPEQRLKAQGTPDYVQLTAAREQHLEGIKSKFSPRVAEFGKAWGVAAIKGASGNRQMTQYAEQMDKLAGEFISRGATFREGRRAESNPLPGSREMARSRTKSLHQDQAAKKRSTESVARRDRIKQRNNDGS